MSSWRWQSAINLGCRRLGVNDCYKKSARFVGVNLSVIKMLCYSGKVWSAGMGLIMTVGWGQCDDGGWGALFRGFRRNGVLIAFNDLMPGYALNKLTDVLKMGVAISSGVYTA